ncbi:N-acetylmuramoyl-L-alanine amidase [Streptomyces sp. DH37]|uniref:N-acetylmuramoyl-L-alanine amidase n=1 Tax=Streptomyces sp. DH37 TaxID=3040122 RepID=UPI0024434115|nr:N-acetylmuramoyl-L-alanine amidase [Streptomyces sp. DH37]MDG9703827.1 N-acetylmuramoyl-L-alanine amidase [Streptomyces sp. DH37]
MATPIGASALVAALRREGLRVVEVGNWRTHNRNHVGAWGPVHGVAIHHTVTSGAAHSVELCRRGYSTLPGPLCHGVITKDGTVHLIGHGRTNHAGAGDGDVLRAVINEAPLPPDNAMDTDGNRHFYGFECENLGDGRDPWPAAQLDAIERASAALCRHHGWTERSVIGHLEWQPGKVDPRGFSMHWMRERIAERLDHAPGWTRGETAAAPAAGETEDEMPEYLSIGQTKGLALPPGRWVPLPWDTEWSDTGDVHAKGSQIVLAGPASYAGDLRLRVAELPAGAELQARIQLDRADGDRSDLPWDEAPATGGTTTLVMPVTGRIGKGTKLRLMACQYGTEPVQLERAELKLQVWKG